MHSKGMPKMYHNVSYNLKFLSSYHSLFSPSQQPHLFLVLIIIRKGLGDLLGLDIGARSACSRTWCMGTSEDIYRRQQNGSGPELDNTQSGL